MLGLTRSHTSLDLNGTDHDNSTPLVLALKQKRIEFSKYLLRLPDIDLTITSQKFGSPLHLALGAMQYKLAMSIIRQSVNTNIAGARDDGGNTPLHAVFLQMSNA